MWLQFRLGCSRGRIVSSSSINGGKWLRQMHINNTSKSGMKWHSHTSVFLAGKRKFSRIKMAEDVKGATVLWGSWYPQKCVYPGLLQSCWKLDEEYEMFLFSGSPAPPMKPEREDSWSLQILWLTFPMLTEIYGESDSVDHISPFKHQPAHCTPKLSDFHFYLSRVAKWRKNPPHASLNIISA